MPSTARLTILAFGATSFLAGLTTLADPSSFLAREDLPAAAVGPVRGNALAAIAMGIYYSLAAYQDNEAFFLATVPMRLLTTVVFWKQDWKVAAAWEGIGATLTALALLGGKRSKAKKR